MLWCCDAGLLTCDSVPFTQLRRMNIYWTTDSWLLPYLKHVAFKKAISMHGPIFTPTARGGGRRSSGTEGIAVAATCPSVGAMPGKRRSPRGSAPGQFVLQVGAGGVRLEGGYSAWARCAQWSRSPSLTGSHLPGCHHPLVAQQKPRHGHLGLALHAASL